MNADEMDADDYIDAAMTQALMQVHAQFGDAIKSHWFNESEICPGCGRQSGYIKHKGKDPASDQIRCYVNKTGIDDGEQFGYGISVVKKKFFSISGCVISWISTSLCIGEA